MTDHLSMTAAQVEALPEGQAKQVLESWVKAKRAELPTALLQSGSKPHAKLAKKALYQLQSSGVQLEAPRAQPPTTPAPAEAAPKHEFQAVLSEQLGTGERAFFFAVPIRGGGLELVQGLVTDEFGIARISSSRGSRNEYRQHLEQLQRDPGSRVMLVPFERVQLELGRAMTMNERSQTPYGAEVEQLLLRLGVTRQDPDVPIPALEASDEASAEDGAALHRERELEQWLPSEAHLGALTTRIDAIRSSALPLSPEQLRAQELKLCHELAAEVFLPAVRQLYARRLWYAAELFAAHGRRDAEGRARAEARRLFHGTAPSRFAQVLFEKVLPTIEKKPSIAGALGLSMPRPKE